MTKDERIDQLSSRVMELREQLRLAQIRAADSEDKAQVMAARVERLRGALEYSCVYLDESRLNSIGSGSKAHMEMDSVLHESLDCSAARVKAEAVREAIDKCAWYGDRVWMKIEDVQAHAQRLIDEAGE